MSTYEISKSSLLSLKAEILRKQQELSKIRTENDVKIKEIKKKTPLDFKNKGIEQRQNQDQISEEETNLLKRSREALEAKSRLYDKLLKSSRTEQTDEEIEHNRRYLVRFGDKNLPPPDDPDDVDKYPESEEDERINENDYQQAKNPEEEWVEYVDCLGRTRTCLRKDLDHLKSNDRDLKEVVEAKKKQQTGSSNVEVEEKEPLDENKEELSEDNELLSSDMRREMLRRKWEEEEEKLRHKSDIHYQDILFNEARTHGVGYYGFSKDEEERAKQQDALKKLREETEKQQKRAQELKSMREKQLKDRIRAAQNRKRVRMGLPPLDESEEENKAKEEEDQQKKEAQEKLDQIKEKEKEKTEKLVAELRHKHVRPWDKGKEGVKEHYEYTQDEWVDKMRKERPQEFAPPTLYKREFRSREVKDYGSTMTDKSLKFSTMKQKIRQPEKMEPVPIDCLIDEPLEEVYVSRERISRTEGVEIAPPPTYDYYGPSDRNFGTKRKVDKANVGDSIEAGLKFLRAQLEKKQSSSRAPEGDIYNTGSDFFS